MTGRVAVGTDSKPFLVNDRPFSTSPRLNQRFLVRTTTPEVSSLLVSPSPPATAKGLINSIKKPSPTSISLSADAVTSDGDQRACNNLARRRGFVASSPTPSATSKGEPIKAKHSDSLDGKKSPAEILIEITPPSTNSTTTVNNSSEDDCSQAETGNGEDTSQTPTTATADGESCSSPSTSENRHDIDNDDEASSSVVEKDHESVSSPSAVVDDAPSQPVTSANDDDEAQSDQILTIETHSCSFVNPKVVEIDQAQEDDAHLREHLDNLQRVTFGRARAEICRNCTAFDEAVARTQRDAVFSDQKMWRNLQFIIREKYTSFAKLEAISRIQEKLQEFVGFVDSSILTNSCWSSGRGKAGMGSLRGPSWSPSATKELPDNLDIMLQLFNSEMEATTATSQWLKQSIDTATKHLENAAKFYQFELELGHCMSWMKNSLDAAALKIDELVEKGYCNWQHSGGQSMNVATAAAFWLSSSYQEIENCTRLMYFWKEKLDRLYASCSQLSPVNKRSPTQRGIFSPTDTFSQTSPSTTSSLLATSAPPVSSSLAGNKNTAVPILASLLLDYGKQHSGVQVTVDHMNTGRSVELPHYWQVSPHITVEKNNNNTVQPSFDVPNYACELISSEAEIQERQNVVTEIAELLVESGRKLLKSLHQFVFAFIRVNLPPLDQSRAMLLMGLDLDQKLDTVNVIENATAFVKENFSESNGDDSDKASDGGNEDLHLILDSYLSALLNERKANNLSPSNASSQDGEDANRAVLVVFNVELLKNLLSKISELDIQWEEFAIRSKHGVFSPPETKTIASARLNAVESTSNSQPVVCSNCQEDSNRFIKMAATPTVVVADSAMQTDEQEPTAVTQNEQPHLDAEPLPIAAAERPVSACSSVSNDSDFMVHSEVAEERRHFTIKGIVRRSFMGSTGDNEENGTPELMSLREAIALGIVNPAAGTCLDLNNLAGEPLPIPVAIQHGFIVVEHQSVAEVVRREHKTEHVITRPSHKRFSAPHSFLDNNDKPSQIANGPRRSSGTMFFVSDDTAAETKTEIEVEMTSTNPPSPPSLPPPPPPPPPPLPDSNGPTTSSKNKLDEPVLNSRRTFTNLSPNRRSADSRPSSSYNNSPAHRGGTTKPRAGTKTVLISREKLSSGSFSNNNNKPNNATSQRASNGTASSSHSSAYVTSAYVEDDEGGKARGPTITTTLKHNTPSPNSQHNNGVAINKSRTVMSMLSRQLDVDRDRDPTPPVPLRSSRRTSSTTDSAEVSPKTKVPVRSQVGARGSVRKMAKFFEQQ